MTHTRRSRFLALAAGLLGAGALAVTMAGSAAATVTPSPSPTPTLRLAPLHLRPEAFIIHSSTAEPGGDGVFTGPVRGASVGNFAPGPDLESLTGPVGAVRLFHTPLGPLVIDWASCTASLHQTGRWALIGVSGADRRSFGFGTYTADVDAILARGFFGNCLGLRVRPVDVDTHVLGTGQAVQLRHRQIAPRLSPALLPAS